MTELSNTTFNDLKLLPGTKIDIRSELYAQFKGYGLYVGFKAGKGLIVTTPSQAGKPLSCKMGMPVVLRFFANHLGSACAFRTEVIHVSTAPFAHLHLSEPKQIEIGEVRNSIRADVKLNGSVFSDYAEGTSCSVILGDLSVDGAKVYSGQALGKAGTRLKLIMKVTVLDKEEVITIYGIARSVSKPEHNEYVYGVQFVDLSDLDKLMIYSVVTTSLIL